jgi:hypothetical protein
MDFAKNNPASNVLGPGLADAMVTDAVKASGFPLQLVVANLLSPNFSLHEEWSYLDSDTQTVRTIDIVATRPLYERGEFPTRARPSVSFVIECKQSDLPYVFFLSGTTPRLSDFPLIAGLKSTEISIRTDDDGSSWLFSPLGVLDLDLDPFLTTDAPFCMNFSKCVRNKSKLSLSGSEAYQGIILPITKAIQHFKAVEAPRSTFVYFDCILIIGLVVIDAPMVGVHVTSDGPQTSLMPWVRVVRHHPMHGEHKSDRSQVYGIDIVHKDFLVSYINQHALPFAQKFAQLTLKHHNVLADVRGFVPGMGKESRNNIEPRLEDRNLVAKGKRVAAKFRTPSTSKKRS